MGDRGPLLGPDAFDGRKNGERPRGRTGNRSRGDVEKAYPIKKFSAKLRRLADALDNGKEFRIQIAGERVRIPASAVINLEHERGGDEEEIVFQLKWKRR